MKAAHERLLAELRACFSEVELRQIADTLQESYGSLTGPSKLLDFLAEHIEGCDLQAALAQQVRP